MKRCPVCFGLVNKKAAKCKHCSADLDENRAYYTYIDNGFSLIEKEFDAFNQKIESVKGSVFPKHQYSEEQLLQSSHIDRIRSIAGKMESDIENWQERGTLSPKLKEYYNEKIAILNDRFQFTIRKLKTRKYSIWERLSEFLICSYYFIINIAFHHIKTLVIPYIKDSNNLMKPFTILQKTAESFEHFLDELRQDTQEDMTDGISYSKRA
jgi:hypothetical protein